MNRKLIPYYLSRALLSAVVAVLVVDPTLKGVFLAIGMWLIFLWFAHGGWYLVDTSHPFAPLRRDERAKAVRNRALVHAVVAGCIAYALLTLLHPAAVSAGAPLGLAALTYLASTVLLFRRA